VFRRLSLDDGFNISPDLVGSQTITGRGMIPLSVLCQHQTVKACRPRYCFEFRTQALCAAATGRPLASYNTVLAVGDGMGEVLGV